MEEMLASGAPRRAVVVFARSAGEERQFKRLAPMTIDGARVERVHRALLDRALETAAEVDGVDVLLVTTGDLGSERTLAERVVPKERLRVLRQPAGTFAERFEYAARAAFEHQYQAVVLIGTDTPELHATHLASAFLSLGGGNERTRRAAIGLSTDGGYYLLGLSMFLPRLFRAVEFRGSRAADQTLAVLAAEGFSVASLEALADLDSARDVSAATLRLRRGAQPRDRFLVLLLETLVATRAAPAFFDEPAALAPVTRLADVRPLSRGP
ncbi:MAG TPA: DUF2064 domain-containing protein [bacterium]|nr:DUF2064 domain-containing protein [bacterium]